MKTYWKWKYLITLPNI